METLWLMLLFVYVFGLLMQWLDRREKRGKK